MISEEHNEFTGDKDKNHIVDVGVLMKDNTNVAVMNTPSPETSLNIPSNPTIPTPIGSSKPPLGKKRPHKLTSDVWNHFERKFEDDKDVAICNYCKTRLKGGGHSGTTSLKNHLIVCSSKANLSITTCFERQKQICLQKPLDGKVRFGNFTFEQEASRKDLASAIIYHEYPLSIVNHVLFRKFVNGLQPLFTMVSRNTVKEDIFKIYSSEKAKLMSVFEKLESRIAITTDMWTSNQNKGYMSITAHFLDESWELQSRILRFIYVPAPHTMDVLANELMDALTEWNIETKISTITVDNYSSNDGMVSIIANKLFSELILNGKILHMRCCAHILNLVVKDGLSIIKDAIVAIRDSVAFWSASPSRVEKFEDVARQTKQVKKLILDDDSTNVRSELDHYLDEKVMPWTEDFDILNWWKLNGIKYPTLKLIAKDFLAIPISTVASESAFSTSGRVVSSHRSRLNPDTLEALMCTQNWLKGTSKVLDSDDHEED